MTVPSAAVRGMVLKPEPLVEAVESLGLAPKGARQRQQVVLLSAQGAPLTQAVARELASLDQVVLLCGRYEGVDERVVELAVDRELSIGDYVLSGGELAAAVVVDAVARLVPGVLGNHASSEFESFGPADALLPARENGARRPAPPTAPAACSTTRTTPAPPSSAASLCPRSSPTATTSRSAAGAESRRS